MAFGYGRYPWERGEVVRYNTAVTFALAAAMDAYLKRKEGPSAHLWDMVADEVYRPIGILHAPMMHTIEPDGSRGIPLLGFGSDADDRRRRQARDAAASARPARWHADPECRRRSTKALCRTSPTGLPTRVASRFGDQRYHLSFWSLPYRTSARLLRPVPVHVGLWRQHRRAAAERSLGVPVRRRRHTYDPETMILAGEAIRPLCRIGAGGRLAG